MNVKELSNLIKTNNGNLREVLNYLNLKIDHNKEEAYHISNLFDELSIEIRVCSICNHLINEGYCIYDGEDYACDDSCLSKILSEEEYINSFNEGSSYYTEWSELDENGHMEEN